MRQINTTLVHPAARPPVDRAEIAARLARHAQACHGSKAAYVASCPACRDLHGLLRREDVEESEMEQARRLR